MPSRPFLRSHDIQGITGTFTGGNIAYIDDRFVLLDTTTNAQRLLVYLTDFSSYTAVPLEGNYSYGGITEYGSSAVLLRNKGVICEGYIAIGELVSVSLSTGNVIEVKEIRHRQNITSLQGITNGPNGLIFTGLSGTQRKFYRIDNDNKPVELANYTLPTTGNIGLTYDGTDIYLSNGSSVVQAYDPRRLTLKFDDRQLLTSGNAKPVGVGAYDNGLAVLDSQPLAVYLYGTAPTPGGGGGGQPTIGGGRQLFMADARLQNFTTGSITFKGIYSEFIRRIPVAEGSVFRIVETNEIRITPEFVLSGVKVDSIITTGNQRFKVTGIIRVGDNFRQSFSCEYA